MGQPWHRRARAAAQAVPGTRLEQHHSAASGAPAVTVSGVRVRSRIVPAVTELGPPHPPGNRAVTSTISLAELLVQPLGSGRQDLVDAYRALLVNTAQLMLVEITPAIAERAAAFRARYALRLPDALQLGAALDRGATHFITNDVRLRRVTELNIIVLADYLAA